MEPEPEWTTVAVAAARTEVPERTLRNWMRGGRIPLRHDGRHVLVDVAALVRLLPTLPVPRHRPLRRGLAGPPRPAGLLLSWPEVELVQCALHDAAEMRAALWAALGGGDSSPDANMDQAARYALMAARLRIAGTRASAADDVAVRA